MIIAMPNWTGNAPPPPRGPGRFVGRSTDLAQLRDRLLPKPEAGRHISLDPTKLFNARTAAKLTQQQAVDKMGAVSSTEGETITFSLGTYIGAEKGRRGVEIRTAEAIAKALNVGIEDLQPEPVPQQLLTVVYGVPGIGKTTLAQAFAHDGKVRETYPLTLWATLGQKGDPQTELASWGDLTDLPGLGKLALGEARRRLAAHLDSHRVLFVVDDVWKTEHAEALAVSGSRSATLVTTRLLKVARELAGTFADAYNLSVLPLEDATDVIVKVLNGQIRTADAEALALAVERHTLGLQVAARLIRKYPSANRLIQELKDLTPLLSEHAPRTEDDAPLSVSAILKLSTNFLDTASRQCFAYLGPMREKPAVFRFSDLEVLWKRLGVDAFRMLNSLEESCLLEGAENGGYTMHALLIAHAREVLAELGPEFEFQCRLDHAEHWVTAAKGKGKR